MNTKFAVNVKAFANQHNITLEEAHKLIQPELFKMGYFWYSNGKSLQYEYKEIIYAERDGGLAYSDEEHYNSEERLIYPLAEFNVTLNVNLVLPATKTLSGEFTKAELEKILKDWDNVQVD